MNKKRWLISSLLVGILMVAITAGVVVAQTPDAEGDQPKESKAARLAEILGGDATEESVQAAFAQIVRENQNAAVQKKLDYLVTRNLMSQVEADAYMAWFKSRPESIRQGLPITGYQHKSFKQRRGGEHRGFLGFRGRGHRAFRHHNPIPDRGPAPTK